MDAIGAALKELEHAGYIVRNQLRGERGRIIDTEYVIYEKPQDRPEPEKPENTPFSPHTENPAQYNTNVFSIQEKNFLSSRTNPSINPSIAPEAPGASPSLTG